MNRPTANARSSSSSSHAQAARLNLGASPPIALPSPARKSSALPLPSLRHNRSFARLAQLFGIGSSTSGSTGASASHDGGYVGVTAGMTGGEGEGEGEEDVEVLEYEEEDEDEDEEGEDAEDGDEGQEEVDEETLLWDAQSALIAHQPALAFEHYTQAALPPHRSSAACLALGHLLTRGSSLSPPSPTSPTVPSASYKGKGRSYSFASPPTSPNLSTRPIEPLAPGAATTSTLPRIASRILNFFSSPEPEVVQSPPERVYTDLVATGWAIPTDGKRAVRDVEGMGVAGGWYVLGLGWIVDGQHQLPLARAIVDFDQGDARGSRTPTITPRDIKEKLQEEQDGNAGVISFNSKRVKVQERKAIHSGHAQEESSSSEGTVLKTPPGGEEDAEDVAPLRDVETTIKLLYDILVPLTRLYRNGHIQANDPVYLPPIQPSQLPDCLRARGDLQKRRNVWHLGAAVARYVLDMSIMKRLSPIRTIEAHRRAVQVMAHYVLGMTASPRQSARHFRIIITLNHSGFEYPDELINQASQRLEILHRSPDIGMHEGAEYPFPRRTRGAVSSMSTMDLVQPRHGLQNDRQRISSMSGPTKYQHGRSDSILSFASSLGTPIKTNLSVASLTTLQDEPRDRRASFTGSNGFSAISSLRKVREDIARSDLAYEQPPKPRWPGLASWTYGSSRPTSPAPETPTSATTSLLSPTSSTSAHLAEPYSPARSTADSDSSSPRAVPRSHLRSESIDKAALADTLEVPLIRHIASTPTLGTLRDKERTIRPGTGYTTPDTFVNDGTSEVNLKVDPVLAAAELNSALTKRAQCSVCAAKGVNFPECRRCGLVFCSRPCRVDETGAGNGKKHVCGAWESRKLLAPPEKDKRGKAVPHGSMRSTPMLAASFKQAGKLQLGTSPGTGGGVVTAC